MSSLELQENPAPSAARPLSTNHSVETIRGQRAVAQAFLPAVSTFVSRAFSAREQKPPRRISALQAGMPAPRSVRHGPRSATSLRLVADSRSCVPRT